MSQVRTVFTAPTYIIKGNLQKSTANIQGGTFDTAVGTPAQDFVLSLDSVGDATDCHMVLKLYDKDGIASIKNFDLTPDAFYNAPHGVAVGFSAGPDKTSGTNDPYDDEMDLSWNTDATRFASGRMELQLSGRLGFAVNVNLHNFQTGTYMFSATVGGDGILKVSAPFTQTVI